MAPRASYQLGELYTAEQLRLAEKILREVKGLTECVNRLEAEVTRPALPRINEVTGHENDARYMAYALIYAWNRR